MTTYSNNAEGGTNGTTVTQGVGGNSGGASGDYFDNINIGASSSLTFDNTHTAHGTLAYKISGGGSGASTFAARSFASATANGTMRLYLYFTGNPVASTTVCGFYSGSTVRARLLVTSTGKLNLATPSAGSATSTGNIPLNAWFRVDFNGVFTTSGGSATVNRYDTPDSGTVTESIGISGVNMVGTTDRARFGVATNATNTIPTFWFDDVAWNDTGAAIGPVPFSGTIAQTLPSLTQSATGTRAVPAFTGAAASTLPSVAQSAAATRTVPAFTATAAQTLPALTQTATGTRAVPAFSGTAAQTLPALTQSAAGAFTGVAGFTATAASVLPALTQSATATSDVPHRTGTATTQLPALTQAAAGSSTGPGFTGTAASTLPALTQSATGHTNPPAYAAVAATTLPSLTQTATAARTVPSVGATAVTILPALTQAARGFVLTGDEITPPERTHTVRAENRTHRVDAENRTHRTKPEPRTHHAPAEDRTDRVPAENRVLEIV